MTAHDLNHAVLIAPQGDLWEGEPCDELEKSLIEAAALGRPVIVDLSSVATMTAHCLGILAHAHETARRNGGRIVVCGAHGLQRWLFDETGLSRFVEVFVDRAAALKALEGAPRAVA
jgi:anti-anti-sigma factor